MNSFMKMNTRALAILSISLLVILSLDFIHSGIYMIKNREILQLWRIEFKRSIKEVIKGFL